MDFKMDDDSEGTIFIKSRPSFCPNPLRIACPVLQFPPSTTGCRATAKTLSGENFARRTLMCVCEWAENKVLKDFSGVVKLTRL